MRASICKVALLALTFVPHVAEGRGLKRDGLDTLVITKGSGGDAAGAAILRDHWRHGKPDLTNLSQTPLEKLDTDKYSCIIIIGQGAVSDVARSAALNARFSEKKVGLYAHLIDHNTLYLLRKLEDRVIINLFFTQSQLTLLKLRNISGYRLLDTGRHQVWRKVPQVIETVSPDKTTARNAQGSPLAKSKNVIWLGGNYTTSTGTQRLFTTDEIVGALKSLQSEIHPGSSVAVILAPRVFEKGMSMEEKGKRLIAIRDAFNRNEVTFYGSVALVSGLENTGIPLQTAPAYDELMLMPWSGRTRHYASVDQYNLFVDMKPEIEPFLLDPNDADQAFYAADYLSGNRASLTSAILKHGCEQK
ncbi:hypothetical protein [Brucella intermedia]|uniref:hypothetical protein n=1 Tax=Brucella intermedia TaxID=94625 RepID=UPI00235FD980|nr:hypothetical protein [Brucella intermedia]